MKTYLIPSLLFSVLLTAAMTFALAQEQVPVTEAKQKPAYLSVLQHHVQLFENMDHYRFEEIERFFSDPDIKVPLVFTTDGFPATDRNPGYHESWHELDPLALVKRFALTTGNKTRLGRVQVQESAETKFAYAAFDFERDCPMHSGEPKLFRFRSTSVLHFTDSGWRIVHMHISHAGGELSGKWDTSIEGPR